MKLENYEYDNKIINVVSFKSFLKFLQNNKALSIVSFIHFHKIQEDPFTYYAAYEPRTHSSSRKRYNISTETTTTTTARAITMQSER